MSSGIEFINPGELRRRLTFQAFSRSQDETGGYQETWYDYLYAWAKLEPKTGKETVEADQIYPDTDTQITIRWRPGLDESMRIIDEYGVQYDIYSISDVELRHRLFTIQAKRRPAGRNA